MRGASRFFLGLFVRLRLVIDLRPEAGGPIFGLVTDVGSAGDFDIDAADVDGFCAALAVG